MAAHLLLWILFLCFCSCATRPEILKEIRTKGVLRVGTTGDYRPFTYLNSQGSYEGMDVQLAQDLAESLNVKLVWIETSWPKLSEDLLKNQFDIAMGGISKTAERENIGHFSQGYWKSGKTPIARCDKIKKFKSLKDIDQSWVKVVVNPGGTNEKFVRTNLVHAQIQIYPDNNTVMNQLVNHSADVMITDSSEVELVTETHKELCATMPGKTFDQSEKAYWMPKDVQWREYVDQWLGPILKSGRMKIYFQQALKNFSLNTSGK